MNLFEVSGRERINKAAPLAERLRPKAIEDFYGQTDILGKGKLLRRAIEADKLQSLIFYGPPGTGKTTLAQIIAQSTKAEFMQINAVTSGIADIKEILRKANDNLILHNKRSILFIDEIHRFNKAQQDALLPAVEKGTVILIGATTENPFFEVNKALLSRSLLFQFKSLQGEDIISILKKAATTSEGLADYKPEIADEAYNVLVRRANGDVRVALNALELAVLTTPPDKAGIRNITKEVVEECIQSKYIGYDKNGDNHYDIVSAFIKSMRGSDPDASLHWLARMLYAGEDPEFIARRIIICAAEDVGLADPMALMVANAAASALAYVGLPEGRIPLAQAVVYIACAPKSNAAYFAIDAALEDVRNGVIGHVPLHLKSSNYSGAKELGHGKGYKYPHDYKENYVSQQYLPDEIVTKKYYQPTQNGNEKNIYEKLQKNAQCDLTKSE